MGNQRRPGRIWTNGCRKEPSEPTELTFVGFVATRMAFSDWKPARLIESTGAGASSFRAESADFGHKRSMPSTEDLTLSRRLVERGLLAPNGATGTIGTDKAGAIVDC